MVPGFTKGSNRSTTSCEQLKRSIGNPPWAEPCLTRRASARAFNCILSKLAAAIPRREMNGRGKRFSLQVVRLGYNSQRHCPATNCQEDPIHICRQVLSLIITFNLEPHTYIVPYLGENLENPPCMNSSNQVSRLIF